MDELKLLIVEDDATVVDTYLRGVKAFNLGAEVKVLAEISKDRNSAFNLLNNSQSIFDAAIVDLDLMGTIGVDKSGNEVIYQFTSKNKAANNKKYKFNLLGFTEAYNFAKKCDH
jgi:hypothetical protein